MFAPPKGFSGNSDQPSSLSDILAYYRENFLPIFAYATAVEQKMPAQVLNEIRNTFDHLARADVGHSTKDNLAKAKNHLDRACLDCVKIAWVAYARHIKELHESYSPHHYMMIEGGAFYRDLSEKMTRFQELSFEARKSEPVNMHNDIKKAIHDYFKAIEAGAVVGDLIESRSEDLSHIATLTSKGSFAYNLKWMLAGAALGAALSTLFTMLLF